MCELSPSLADTVAAERAAISSVFRGVSRLSAVEWYPNSADSGCNSCKVYKVLEKFTKFEKFEKFEEFEEFEKIEKLNFLKCVDGGKRVDDW